jgi:uncharacterized membrane protein AbrB (regulator of aidB expression)
MPDAPLIFGAVKFVHLLLFVYWLGGDAGVYYASGFVIDPKLSRDARLTAFKIFSELDMLPRYCLALTLSVGGLLAYYAGIPHPPALLPFILLLGPLWVLLVWLIHHNQGSPLGQKLARFDYFFRCFMIVALIASVGYAFGDGRLAPYPWLAAKLLLFAFLIFCGLVIRTKLPRFVEGYRQMVMNGASTESDRKMSESLRACRPYVLAIWAGIAASALLGIFKPGGGI